MVEIVEMMCYTDKSNSVETRRALLNTGGGMEGDRHADGVSIISEEAKLWQDGQAVKGLCFNKYRANLVVRRAEPQGEPAAVLYAAERKSCYPECTLLAEGIECKLAKGAFLAAIVRGGIVYVGDLIEVIEAE